MSPMSLSKFRLSNERTVLIAIFLALAAFGAVLAYVALTSTPGEGFISMYVLDSGKMAVNYPQSLVIGKNNTMHLWVGVGNFMGKAENCSVLVKIYNGTIQKEPVPVDPVQRYQKVLSDKDTWEFPVTMTLNQTGTVRVIFELWLFGETGGLSYSGNSNSIWINVIRS